MSAELSKQLEEDANSLQRLERGIEEMTKALQALRGEEVDGEYCNAIRIVVHTGKNVTDIHNSYFASITRSELKDDQVEKLYEIIEDLKKSSENLLTFLESKYTVK